LSDHEERTFLKELNGDVYRQSAPRRLYLLLRLDSAISDGSATYEHGVISIEHVLPQTPDDESLWSKSFPNKNIRDKWVHRLGNLVLLSQKKNSSASNYDFDKKKTTYFAKGGVSPFPLTTQVLCETAWTPEVLERRQRNSISFLHQLWRLNADLDDLWIDDADPGEESEVESAEKNSGFHGEIIPLLEQHFGGALEAGPNMTWASSDGSTVVSCQVSKRYNRKSRPFWFGLKRAAKERLENAKKAFCAFGLGTPNIVALLPYEVIRTHLGQLRTSPDGSGGIRHWHVEFREDQGRILLIVPGDRDDIDVSGCLVKRK